MANKVIETIGTILNPAPKILSGVAKFLGADKLAESLGAGQAAESLYNSWTKAGPTGEQLWQLEQQNTTHQRNVADLEAAGINSALYYGGSGNAPSSPQLSSGAGMSLSDMVELATLPQRIRGLELDNEAKAIDVEWAEREHAANYDNIITQVSGSQLDNKAKAITNAYLVRMQEAELRVKDKTAEQLESSSKELDKHIELMDVQELETFVRACDTAEHINFLVKQEELSDAQIRELDGLVAKLRQETRVLKLNADNFDDITVIGSSSSNYKFGPVGSGESRPITLADKKRYAQELADKKRSDRSKDWNDIKREYPE